MRRLALLLAFGSLASGCAGLADAPPSAEPQLTNPDVQQLSPVVDRAATVSLPKLARDGATRRAEKLTVRVRNTGCDDVTLGSGFAVSANLLITNRHVLAGAEQLEISTWEGRSQQITFAYVGALGDIGFARVDQTLPQVGRFGPPAQADDLVSVVGYPLGGPLTIARGVVVDRDDGSRFDLPGEVLRMTAHVEPGNSGGPVLDERGRIVAVVFAIEIATGYGLAIPIETMVELIKAGGFEDVPGCGYE